MTRIADTLTSTTVKLDDKSRKAVAEINEMINSAGRMPLLLSIAHFFGWAEKDISGPINVATEDWLGFAKAMNGIAVIQLDIIYSIAEIQAARFTLNDGNGQREFWNNVAKAAHKAKMERAK